MSKRFFTIIKQTLGIIKRVKSLKIDNSLYKISYLAKKYKVKINHEQHNFFGQQNHG